MSRLVKDRLAGGPCTIDDLAQTIANKDRTLDIKSAKILTEAGVASLKESGDVTVQEPYISLARTGAMA